MSRGHYFWKLTFVLMCSQLVKGMVFKKHAAHKHMPTNYKKPRLLLIQGALDRSLRGLSSFESMKQVTRFK